MYLKGLKNVITSLFFVIGSQDMEDLPPGIGQYDDFHTIDWQRDIARDRMRHRYIVKKRGESICDLIRGFHDAWSGWLCVLLAGLAAGKSISRYSSMY